MKRSRALAALAVLAVLAAGCGIRPTAPFEVGPRPDGLGSGPRLFFVRGERLYSVTRDGLDDLSTRIGALVAGPTAEEKAEGLGSDLPEGLAVEAVTGYPRVTLTLSGARSISRLGLQQIACTAATSGTETPVEVRVTLSGQALGTHSCPLDG
ncbi:hypothetical protein SAMN05421505_13453 [Sinosporangium album]|uniref:GerMN domain-containing protein n=1 Tax=Sinosporangium album TaxID=504805 RepID=A0A1G8HY91_9ACTN|nr:GerMN domain-containing protein [Sinosporangium album]SDI11577.1 hypothetical protein SAMN05421505_13453 [Sinosporangium album]